MWARVHALLGMRHSRRPAAGPTSGLQMWLIQVPHLQPSHMAAGVVRPLPLRVAETHQKRAVLGPAYSVQGRAGMRNLLKDPFGRQRFVEREPKEILYRKNADGTVDTTPRVLMVFPIF